MAVRGAQVLNYYDQRIPYEGYLHLHLQDNSDEPRRLYHRTLSSRAYKPPKTPIFNEPDWKPKRIKRRLLTCVHPTFGKISYYNGRPIRVSLEKSKRLWTSRYIADDDEQQPQESTVWGLSRGLFTLVSIPSLLAASVRFGNRSVRIVRNDSSKSYAEWLPDDDWKTVRVRVDNIRRASASLAYLLYLSDIRQVYFEKGTEEIAGALSRIMARFYLDASGDRPDLIRAFMVQTMAQYALDFAGMSRDGGWNPPLTFYDAAPEPLPMMGIRQAVTVYEVGKNKEKNKEKKVMIPYHVSRKGVSLVMSDASEYPINIVQIAEPALEEFEDRQSVTALVHIYNYGPVAAHCPTAGVTLLRKNNLRHSRLIYTVLLIRDKTAPKKKPLEEDDKYDFDGELKVDEPKPTRPLDVDQKLFRNFCRIRVPNLDPDNESDDRWLRFLCGILECVAEKPVVVDAAKLDRSITQRIFEACCVAGTARKWGMAGRCVTLVRDEAMVPFQLRTDPMLDFGVGLVPINDGGYRSVTNVLNANVIDSRWGAFDSFVSAGLFAGAYSVPVEVTLKTRTSDELESFPSWIGSSLGRRNNADTFGTALQTFSTTQRDADLLQYLESGGLGGCYARQRVMARKAITDNRDDKTFYWDPSLETLRGSGNYVRNRLEFFLPRTNIDRVLVTDTIQFADSRNKTVTVVDKEVVRLGLKVVSRKISHRSELLQLTGPRAACFGPDDVNRLKWIEFNGWLGGIGAIEWSPEPKTPLFYFEPERVTKRRTVERNLNDYQKALFYAENDRRHYFSDWVGMVCSMLELDPEIMMIWCRACCVKFHAFGPKRRGLDSSMTEGTPIPYVKRLDASALRPFKADKDVIEAVASCHGDSAKEPRWAALPVACRTVPTRRTAAMSQKQHAHIINALVNEHGYTPGLSEYAFESIEAYEYLLVGAFVLTHLKKTTLDVLLLDIGQISAAADSLLNTAWYTVDAPSCFLVKHHTASYGNPLECLVALTVRSCAWVQCDKGSALVHTADSCLAKPSEEPVHATKLRIVLMIFLTLFEYSKLDEDVWLALLGPLLPTRDIAPHAEAGVEDASVVTYSPNALHDLEDALTREAAALSARIWRDLDLTELDVSDALCGVFWRLFSIYVGAVAPYKRVPACVALNGTTYDAAVPADGDYFLKLPRVSCRGITFSVRNPWNDLRHAFVILSDNSKGSDDVVHRHIVMDELTTIYTPDLDREMVVLPDMQDRLTVRWKESYRECAISYFDRQRVRTCETYLPDCLPEFLQAAVLESDPYTLKWTIEPRMKPMTDDSGRVQELIGVPFRFQSFAVSMHPLSRPHLGATRGTHRILKVETRKGYRYQTVFEPDDLKLSVRARGARGRGEASTAQSLPIPSSSTEFPDELELTVASVPDNPSIDRYVRTFASRIVYDSRACRHLFTTVFLRPLESIDDTLNAMGHAIPKTKRKGGWLLVEFKEMPQQQTVAVSEWYDKRGAPFAQTVAISCKARCLKPALVNCLFEKWRGIKPALTVIRTDCSGVATECIEAVLTVNMTELPTFRCVVVQNPDGLDLDAQFFRDLDFIDDVRPLQPEREVSSQYGMGDKKRDVRQVFVALDQLHRKTDILRETKDYMRRDKLEIMWTSFDSHYKFSSDDNYIVVYETGNKWTLPRLKELLKKSPLARATVCLRSPRESPSYTDLEGRLLVNFFKESPVMYLSKWLKSFASIAPVSRLGPDTISFQSYPDYGSFFDDARRVNADERKLQVLTMPAATGGRYFFTVDSQAPQQSVFEHALIRHHLEMSLTVESAMGHGVDVFRASFLMNSDPMRWNWKPIRELLTSKRRDHHLGKPRWYGACLDDMTTDSWRDCTTIGKLTSPWLEMIDSVCPGAIHTERSTVYTHSVPVMNQNVDRDVSTKLVVDYPGEYDAVVSIVFDDTSSPSVKFVGVDIEGSPVFVQSHREVLFACFMRLYSMGCVKLVVEYDEEDDGDEMFSTMTYALELMEKTCHSRFAYVSVGGYVKQPMVVLHNDIDQGTLLIDNRFDDAFHEKWAPAKPSTCRDLWRSCLSGSAAFTPEVVKTLRLHRDYKRQLLALPLY
ncbi:hypothetical protein [Crucian carp herpesvirus]|uniref:ORF42 n=1 Tax=Cyprinid herpesvirus 2 TaxID=317878 RepID=A0A120HV38_CYHV2|nr:ORF42 [Cyprinid herpesvirus 2]APB92893.2 hypothetical protein [Crucian carp herpesvirus]